MKYQYTIREGRFEQIESPFLLNKNFTPPQYPRFREKKIREKAGMTAEGIAALSRVPIYHYLAWEDGTGFIPDEEADRIRNLFCVIESNQNPSIKSTIPVNVLKSNKR